MLRPIDNWFLQQEEPAKSCLEFLRIHIPSIDNRITEEWKYGLPFYYINGKMLCYLWTNKKTGQPYIGFADGNKMDFPELIQEKRSRMKIFMIDAEKDLPVKKITLLLKVAIEILESK